MITPVVTGTSNMVNKAMVGPEVEGKKPGKDKRTVITPGVTETPHISVRVMVDPEQDGQEHVTDAE